MIVITRHNPDIAAARVQTDAIMRDRAHEKLCRARQIAASKYLSAQQTVTLPRLAWLLRP